MWSIQTLAILILFYVVVLTDEFKDNKTVKEIKPLLDALKSGEYYLTKNPQCADITFNASNLYFRPVNYTAPNPYPTPTPR